MYRTPRHVVADSHDRVLVIHCSDPRYQAHFQDFLQSGLRLNRYALLAIPGGVQTLTLSDYLPKFSWAGWRWLKFLETLTGLDRIILIAHDDCRWYLTNRFASDKVHARSCEVEDLRRTRAALADRFGAIPVQMYYATLEGDQAAFELL